jgi:hypothetical protein
MLHSTISQRKGCDVSSANVCCCMLIYLLQLEGLFFFCQLPEVDPILNKNCASECQTMKDIEISGGDNSTPDKFSCYILLVNATLLL